MICFARTVTRDVELGGQQMRAGDRVGLLYPSANRDDEGVRRSESLRHPALAEPACRVRRWRTTLLPRRQPRPKEIQVMIGALLRRFDDHRGHRRTDLDERGTGGHGGVAIQSLPVRLA